MWLRQVDIFDMKIESTCEIAEIAFKNEVLEVFEQRWVGAKSPKKWVRTYYTAQINRSNCVQTFESDLFRGSVSRLVRFFAVSLCQHAQTSLGCPKSVPCLIPLVLFRLAVCNFGLRNGQLLRLFCVIRFLMNGVRLCAL